MPDVEPVGYVAAWWQDMGMVGMGGMGPVPISSTEVMAWAAGMGIHLTPWEFATVREMSRAYLHQQHESEKPECVAPFGSMSFDRDVVEQKLRNVFGNLSQRKH